MRLAKRDFAVRINRSLRVEFGSERLTSYAGLEVVLRFLRGVGFRERLHGVGRRLGFGGDVGFASMMLLVIGMLLTGARRLRHIDYVRGDPILHRFAGLARLPDRTTLARWLRSFKGRTWSVLDTLIADFVGLALSYLRPATLTLDIDGTVVTTGLEVERAFRGFNPHRRKNPSYYPILACVAQTGQVVAHKNRSGDVHDSVGSAAFVRKSVRTLREHVGFLGKLEVRTDGAFFQRDLLELYDRINVEYATKVPMWPWLNLRARILEQPQSAWFWADREQEVQGLDLEVDIRQWQRKQRVVIYRKRVGHKPVKGVQLDLFNPNDGYWEYCAVATNRRIGIPALWHFMNGRGAQEKIISELKGAFAFDAVPTSDYGANTAWQKLNVLTHNLVVAFQFATGAPSRAATRKKTAAVRLESMRTIRFEWMNRAGRIINRAGRTVLRQPNSPVISAIYVKLTRALSSAA